MTTTNITYEPVENWAKMPLGISFYGDCGGVAVDSKDNVYVFNRGTDPVCVFDESGNFLRSFGHGEFDRPHGIEIDLDDNIYLVDDGPGNFVQKRNNNGDIIIKKTLNIIGKKDLKILNWISKSESRKLAKLSKVFFSVKSKSFIHNSILKEGVDEIEMILKYMIEEKKNT